jgi:hypothetical protein
MNGNLSIFFQVKGLVFRTLPKTSTMTMWADNIKFVKDIIDGKYQKIDAAAAEVTFLVRVKIRMSMTY